MAAAASRVAVAGQGQRPIGAAGRGRPQDERDGEAGEDDPGPVETAAADARYQADVRDQTVHGAEDRWAQPAATDIPVFMLVLPGIVAYALFPEQMKAKPDSAYPTLVLSLLPVGLVVIHRE